MEGPSLYLAAEQLAPLVGKKIVSADGNTKIGKERLNNQKVLAIFSWGKYLFFQFDTFALRVHFMLFGSFEATIKGVKVTGDYPRRERPIRLGLHFKTGEILMYNCSLRYVESAEAIRDCDFTVDTMSSFWSPKKAFSAVKKYPDSEIADVLLDQAIFMGVGNIIKNECLLLVGMHPQRLVKTLSDSEIRKLITVVREYVFQFYAWRKEFVLKQHYQIYRQSICKKCGGPVARKKTGSRQRFSYICSHCEK